MKILITGGCGLVGIHTARKFAENGQMVVCYDVADTPWYAEQIMGPYLSRVIFVKGDIKDFNFLAETTRRHGIRGIVHSAAVVNERNAREDPIRAAEVNIIGTLNVLEVAKSFELERLVYTSSGTIYGRRADMRPIKEEEINPQNFYSETKYAAERLLDNYRRLFSVNAITIRISTAYGPGKPWEPQKYPIQRLCWEALYSGGYRMPQGGDYERDFTFISDVASGIFLAYYKQSPAYTIYNISSGRGHTLAEVVSALNGIVPNAKLEIGGGRFEDDFALSGSLRGPLDIGRAKEDLGFSPGYSLEAGLSAYLRFIKENSDRFKR